MANTDPIVSEAKGMKFKDQLGRHVIREGDRVFRVAVDDGAPLYVTRGTVVGFGRTRIQVKWDGIGYDTKVQYHNVRTEPRWDYREAYVLRVITD